MSELDAVGMSLTMCQSALIRDFHQADRLACRLSEHPLARAVPKQTTR